MAAHWIRQGKLSPEDMRRKVLRFTQFKPFLQEEKPKVTNLTGRQKLKQAIKDYGSTVIIFHVTISLMSLGLFYLAVSSGLDVATLTSAIGLDEGKLGNIAAGASTFIIAYSVHKVFAPVRISITLGATPFIVRYLRKVGFLKPPKN